MSWRIWYGEAACVRSEDCDPFDAPGLGVQVVMQYHPINGRWAQMGHDYYVWQEGQWVGCDLFGLFDYLQQQGPRKVLFGRTISNERYEATYRMAEADKSLPTRSNRKFGEPKP